jgi:hypothetical protein
MEDTADGARARVDYTVLPSPVRLEDMRAAQEVRPFDEGKSEWDRETGFLLRTCGVL